jgi:tRNA-splicing ligase RtcB
MDLNRLERSGDWEWHLPRAGRMNAPAVLYGSEALLRDMDEKVLEQIANVASLPGIVQAAFVMPDAHWGYGFPIGGVAAFDPEVGGVVSAGGVGFDISCGVRTLLSDRDADDVATVGERLADALFRDVPAGVGSTGSVRLGAQEMTAMLREGARWAVARGFGDPTDLERIENGGCLPGAAPEQVSDQARRRQTEEMGTLGSGNHYLEVQRVAEVHDPRTAACFGLRAGQAVVSIHCGSRGLGHQVATDYSRRMVTAAAQHGIALADRELACVPVRSPAGEAYLGAMRCAANCALANRQMLAHLVRRTFNRMLGPEPLPLLYDVSHNFCSEEVHAVGDAGRTLFVHRKGATRALGPGHPDVPADLQEAGQPVLVGGTMGTASYILAGTAESEARAFISACHGAGRSLSRTQATRKYQGRDIVDRLARRRILIRTRSYRGIAEEAPEAYKDVDAVVEATVQAGLARLVARLEPMICVKG